MDTQNWRHRHTIKGSILLIKAKILIGEPNEVIFNFFTTHFGSLSVYGEYYNIEHAISVAEINRKAVLHQPDICLVNSSLMTEYYKSVPMNTQGIDFADLKIITYNTEKAGNITDAELDKVTKEVKTACLKYGFLTVKWTEL